MLDGMLFKYDMDMLAKSSIDEHKKQALKVRPRTPSPSPST